MTEDVERTLEGVDSPRDMPAQLRARLESALLTGPDALTDTLDESDAPRPLPPDLRARLEASLMAGAAGGAVPHRLRRRVERALGLPAPARRARVLAAAAALVLVVASVAAAVRFGGGAGQDVASRPDSRDDFSAGSAPESGDIVAGEGSAGAGEAGSDVSGPPTTLSPLPGGPALGTGGVGGGPDEAEGQAGSGGGGAGGSAPPFAYGGEPPAATEEDSVAPQRSATPLAVGVVEGGGEVAAGFRAYVGLLNESGGIGGRPIELRSTSATQPVVGTIATVNLSTVPLADAAGAPAWVQRPLLEGVDAPEVALRDDVFSFSSVLERQAHLAALDAFPQPAPGATAAIYHSPRGPYATRVPAALEEALRARGVATVRVPVESGSATAVPADVAFLSLPTAEARAFLAGAQAQEATDGGVWGIGSLFDESLLKLLPDGTRVLSPYTLPGTAEASALRHRSDRLLSTSTVHGWVTAKMLALALWQSGATTPEELTGGLERLTGYENGFMPSYEVRPGTRSRTPEGLVLVPGDQFTPGSPFRRDPF